MIYMTLIADAQLRLGAGFAADVATESGRRATIRTEDKLLTFERLTVDKPAIGK